MPLVGFELTISAGERPQTYALDRAVTETGLINLTLMIFYVSVLYECMYSLLNGCVSNSDYRALNARMIREM